MVDVLGHFAMAFLWSFPAWFRWDGRVSLAFIGLAVSTAMLPDVDLLLRELPIGVHHHGVTHTVLFVTAFAIVVGIAAAHVLAPLIERWWIQSEGHAIPRHEVHVFVTGGLLVGGLSHIFADMLSAPDISQPVEPLWPFLNVPISFDLIYYTAPAWNAGLLLVALALHLVAGYVDVQPLRHRSNRQGR